MASKRNSRVFSDELSSYDDLKQKSSSASYRSRRSSRSSLREDMFQAAADLEDGQRGSVVVKEVTATVRHPNLNGYAKEATSIPSSRSEKPPRHSSLLPTISQATTHYQSAPLEGRPLNFGVVVPGLYRSSYPKSHDYDYLKSLELKTVVTLVKKDELDGELSEFLSSNGIQQVTFNMKGTKKESIPLTTMAPILQLMLDSRNYPLLLHCNHGKHRTGCIVAAARKIAGWDIGSVLEEYRSYAVPKVRDCDIDFISAFQASLLPKANADTSQFSPVQIKTFFRTLLFSTFVVVIWLVSGSQMSSIQASVGESY